MSSDTKAEEAVKVLQDTIAALRAKVAELESKSAQKEEDKAYYLNAKEWSPTQNAAIMAVVDAARKFSYPDDKLYAGHRIALLLPDLITLRLAFEAMDALNPKPVAYTISDKKEYC